MARRPKFAKPNIVDKVVGFFDPAAGKKRLYDRTVLAMAAGSGGYDAGRRDNRRTRNWRPGDGSANADLLPDLPDLRQRSRDLDRNNPLAHGAIETINSNAVGPGLRPKAQVDADAAGISEEEAQEWGRAADREFDLWANSPDADLTRVQNFYQLQALVLRSVLINGDCFTVRRYKPRPGKPLGHAVQVIEADQVSTPNHRQDTERMAAGVEVDADGAPVAYHMQKDHPGALSKGATIREWVRMPAFTADGDRLVYHHFDRLRAGQHRGAPILAPVTESLRRLDEYSQAELDAALVAACFAVFVKTEMGEGINDLDLDDNKKSPDEDEFSLAPGLVMDLTPGESIDSVNPGRPNAQFDPFFVAVARQIGVGLGIPFEVLIKHFTASYSAARAAILEAWRTYNGRRIWLVRSFCGPTRADVLAESISRGRLKAPGFWTDPLVRAAYLACEWYGPAMPQLDPVKEANAAKTRVEEGFSTRAEETAALTGGDFEAKHRQRVREEQMRKEGGLAAVAAPAEPAQTEPEEPETPPNDLEGEDKG